MRYGLMSASFAFFLSLFDYQEAKDWFGEDGVLIALPNPLKEYAERPPIVEEVAPLLQTEYKKVSLT